MLTYTYKSKGKFGLVEKPKPVIQHERDAIVKVTLASICSGDLHIKHGSVPRAVEGIMVGHEMVGIVEGDGSAVTHVKPGDRVTVNVETFCGECFFCKKGFVNNCTDKNSAWLPHRWRSGRVRSRAVCGSGAEQDSRHRDRQISSSCWRRSRHGLLGGEDLRRERSLGDHRGRYRSHHRSRPHGNLHTPLRDAEESQAHYRVREGRKSYQVCERTLSQCDDGHARRMP